MLTDSEIIAYVSTIKALAPVTMHGNMVTCPDPEHHDTVTPSCVVDRSTGKFFCYGCWAHGVVGEPWNPAMRWTPPPPKESEIRRADERWQPNGCRC